MSSASDTTLNCLYRCEDSPAAQRLLASLIAGDVVLLLGEAVTLARDTHPALGNWLASGAQLYALEEDARAYAASPLHEAITLLDYAGWVSLSERHRTQTVWR